MKKFAIFTLMILFGIQAGYTAGNVKTNYNKKPAQQTKPVAVKKQQPKSQSVQNDDNYLLKYNINDLEAAPWLNNGKRKI